MIERQMRYDALKVTFLHLNQFAYGQTCELIIHELSCRAERGPFLDIESAFDNTAYKPITRGAKRRQIGTPIIKWIDFALRNKIVILQVLA